MQKYIRITFLTVFWLGFLSIQAQNTGGKDFWLTFGANDPAIYKITDLNLQLRIVSTNKQTAGTIHFTNLNTSVSFLIPEKQVFTYNLSEIEKTAVLNTTTGVTDCSIHITSNEPVTVYAQNQAKYSTDATNVLPVTVLGSKYYHISYTTQTNRQDAYAIVGTKNNTHLYHNGTLVATINQGQVYYRSSTTDMTGSHISANNPVAFFALNQGVRIPANYCCTDNLMQQLAPVSTWGTLFFVPVSPRTRDIVRIVASQDNTTITQIGGTLLYPQGGQTSLTNLKAGQFVELEVLLSNNGCYIQSNNPVGVCTYLTGSVHNQTLTGIKISDPAQSWLPAIEQTITEATISPFIPIGVTAINEHYALVITPTSTKQSTRVSIGGEAETELKQGSWRDNANAGISFYTMPMTNASASYHFTNKNGLIILCCGLGLDESYYYSAYSAMKNLFARFFANDVIYNDLSSQFFCKNDVTFRAELSEIDLDSETVLWYIDGTEEINARNKLVWSKNFSTGSYEIKMIVQVVSGDTLTLEGVLNIGAVISATPSTVEGGSVTGDGCYQARDSAHLTATPSDEYNFISWMENNIPVSTNASYSFVVTKPRNLVALFEKKTFTVNVDVNNNDCGYATGMGVYKTNDLAKLEAFANRCYLFKHWTINNKVVSTDNPFVFIVTENKNLVAHFVLLDFDTYAPILWDNTFMLNLRKLREDGFQYTGCKWYKNGIEEPDTRTIDEFSYSAGPNEGDLLELAPTYYRFELITKNFGNLCSNNKTIDSYTFNKNLWVYPNPVLFGGLLTIEGFTQNEPIYIYNRYGACINSFITSENTTTLSLNYAPGIYLIRSNNKTTKVIILK